MFRKKTDFNEISNIIDYKFKDKNLLLRALTRTSAILEGRQSREIGDFQRLEFIGDKVLNLVISQVLLKNYPTWSVGQLTKETSRFVNNNGPLAEVAMTLKLGKFLIMGIGEDSHNQARENTKVLSDAMEALIGAIWLDSGENYNFMSDFIIKHWSPLGLVPVVEYRELAEIYLDHHSSKSERTARLKEALSKAISQDTLDKVTELFCGNVEQLSLILAKKPSQDRIEYAFELCIRQAELPQVELLLQHNANPNVVFSTCDEEEVRGNDYTISALNLAILSTKFAASNRLKIIEILLKNKADPNWQEGEDTIITYDKSAPKKQGGNLMGYFASTLPGAFYEIEQNPSNFGGYTLDELLNHAKHRKVEKRKNLKMSLHYLFDSGLENYCVDVDRQIEIAELLLRYGAKINTYDAYKNIPLHCIINQFRMLYLMLPMGEEEKKLIQFMIDNKADLDLPNKQGKTCRQLLKEYFKLKIGSDKTTFTLS